MPTPQQREQLRQTIKAAGIEKEAFKKWLAGLGATALGGAGLYNAHDNAQMSHNSQVGGTAKLTNPFRWTGGPSEETVFANNVKRYEQMRAAQEAGLARAEAQGRPAAEILALRQRLQSDDFGNGIFGGSAADYRQRAVDMQKRMQQLYNAEVGKYGHNPELEKQVSELEQQLTNDSLLPGDDQRLQTQITGLRERLGKMPGYEDAAAKQIRERMENAKMRFRAPIHAHMALGGAAGVPGLPAQPVSPHGASQPTPGPGGVPSTALGPRPGGYGRIISTTDHMQRPGWESTYQGHSLFGNPGVPRPRPMASSPGS